MINRIKAIAQRNSMKSFLGNGLISGIGMLTFIFLARGLTLEDFGIWVLFLVIFNLMETIRMGLIRQSLVHYYHTLEDARRSELTGSAFVGAIIFSVLVAGLIGLIHYWIPISAGTAWYYFLLWYPALVLLSLFPDFLSWVFHAHESFYKMNSFRFIRALGLFSFAVACFFKELGIEELLLYYFFLHLGMAVLAILSGFNYFLEVRHFSRDMIEKIWWFGKNSLSTLMGSNLLKSTDQLLIGYFMGPAAAGLYAVPLKILEFAELPVRSFAAASYPPLVRHATLKEYSTWEEHIFKRIFTLSAFFIPFFVFAQIFPEPILTLLGGEGMQAGAKAARVLLVFILLIPVDRYMGLALDSLQLPQLNARKVWMMVAVNLLGDLGILYFWPSLAGVALVSILNATVGVYFAWNIIARKGLFSMHRIAQLSLHSFSKLGKKGV